MKASVNPYYLRDTEGGYYNKYPEFQVWEECRQAIIKEVVEWIESHTLVKPNKGSITRFEPFYQIEQSELNILRQEFLCR